LSVASFVLSAPAASDLREIHAYIAADDPAAARRVLGHLRDAMHRLAELPGLGHVRDDLATRRCGCGRCTPYLVIYRPETRPLQIVRVLSGYRDIATVLE
jgi:plasmid stabilization system protein ParE